MAAKSCFKTREEQGFVWGCLMGLETSKNFIGVVFVGFVEGGCWREKSRDLKSLVL